jgi:hypothetical protein
VPVDDGQADGGPVDDGPVTDGTAKPAPTEPSAEVAGVSGEDAFTPADAAGDGNGDVAVPVPPGPQGPGWVIQIVGHHYHNEDRHKPDEDEQFVRKTIVRNLLGRGDKVTISAGPQAGDKVDVGTLGIGYPVIVESLPVKTEKVPYARPLSVGEKAAPAEPAQDAALFLKRYDFTLQFCWQPGEIPGLPASARTSTRPSEDTF